MFEYSSENESMRTCFLMSFDVLLCVCVLWCGYVQVCVGDLASDRHRSGHRRSLRKREREKTERGGGWGSTTFPNYYLNPCLASSISRPMTE